MKKIIFIELFHHHECLENPFLHYKKKNYKTKLILGDFLKNKIKNINKYKDDFYILKQPNRKNFKDISKIKLFSYIIKQFFEMYKNIKIINKIMEKEKPNFLYINTIESPFAIPLLLYLLKLKNIKIITTIHNTNRLKIGFLKYFSFDFLIKKLIKKSYKIVLLGKYLKFENKKTQKKVIYFNNRLIIKKKMKKFKKITFVLTGNLNQKEKDFEIIFKNFNLLKKKNLKKDFQLIILTKINNEILNLIKKYKIEKICKIYEKFVDEKEFEKVMLKSHYLILSTKENSPYGKYTISGSFGDAIGFNLPILLCENYSTHFKDKNIIRFKKNNLDKILWNLLKK